MATSGSFNTSSVGNFYFTVSWERTGYSSSNNTHTIKYSVVAHNTPGNYRSVYHREINVNGEKIVIVDGSTGSKTAYYDGDLVYSNSKTISSSNSAGDGNVSISFAAGVGSYPGTNASGSGAWALDRIPRYTSFTEHKISLTTMNVIEISWTAADVCSASYYSLNGGSWQLLGTGDQQTGAYTIGPLSENTSYNIRTKIIRKDSGLETISGYLYPTTKARATISDVQTLTLPAPNNSTSVKYFVRNYSTQNTTIYLEKLNTAGRYNNNATQSWGHGADGWGYHSISASTVNKMYSDYPSSTSFSMQLVAHTQESYDYYDVDPFTVQITETNAGPTGMATCTYLDTNEQVRKLTGSSATAVSSGLKIIPGYSNVQINVPANPITIRPYSGATQGTVSIGGRAAKTATTASSETFYGATAGSYDIVGRDSRNFPATRRMDVTTYPYSGLTITSFVAKRNSTDNTTGTYTITGKYQVSNYGGSTTNSITGVTVTCSGITVGNPTITSSSGNWTATGTLSNLKVGTSYTLNVSVSDYAGAILGIANKTSSTSIDSGRFLMTALKGKGVRFGGMYNTAKECSFQSNTDSYIEHNGSFHKIATTSGRRTNIDLTSSTYDVNTYYPVYSALNADYAANGFMKIKVCNQLNGDSKPSWSTHASGFTANLEVYMKANGWGTTDGNGYVTDWSYRFCDKNPLGVSQLSNSSNIVLWMRGGAKYHIYSDQCVDWAIATGEITILNQSIAPSATNPGLNIGKTQIYAQFYPIGAIYMSTDPTDPNAYFGGSWERIQGRFLYATGSTPGTTGGSTTSNGPSTNTSGGPSTNVSEGPSSDSTSSTALSLEQMPWHRHHIGSRTTIATGSNDTWRAISSEDTTNNDFWFDNWTNYQGSGWGHTHTLNGHTHGMNWHTHSLSSHTHYVMPPYYEVYVWRRIG